MDDLDTRLGSAHNIEVPELWPQILRRAAEEDPKPPHERDHRGATLVISLVAVLAVLAGTLWAVSGLRRGAAPSAPTSPLPVRPVTESIRTPEYPATCTATLSSSVVRPGDAILVSFSVRNAGSRDLRVSTGDPYGSTSGRLVIKDSVGRVLFDVQSRHEGQTGPGPTVPAVLAPFSTMAAKSESVVIRWTGPLLVQAFCPPLQLHDHGPAMRWSAFPRFRVAVEQAGPALSPKDAMDRAVARTDGLFERCRPGSGGEPINGTLLPPRVSGDAAWRVRPQPLRATCWARVESHPGFALITLYFANPLVATLPSPDQAELFGLPPLGPGTTAEVGVWQVVVTASRAVTTEFPRSHARSGAPGDFEYEFYRGRWEAGGFTCGSGEVWAGPAVFFPPPGLNACRATP